MLNYARTQLQHFILGDVDLYALKRDHKALLDEIARLQEEASSHRERLRCLECDLLTAKNVSQRLQTLESEALRLSGSVQAAVNSAGAANSRGERNEQSFGALMHQFRQWSANERDNIFLETAQPPQPPRAADVALPTKQETCPTCRGTGGHPHLDHPGAECLSCNGYGHIEVVPG